MYATFSEILDVPLPDLRAGAKGAEDSLSVLSAWRGKKLPPRPAFFNDHKESRDGAASAIRLDNPTVGGKEFPGQWKLFLDAGLIREGQARPVEMFDLVSDPMESRNRLGDKSLAPLVGHLVETALLHRNAGGHRLAAFAPGKRVVFDWRRKKPSGGVKMTLDTPKGRKPHVNDEGLGLSGGGSEQVNSGEALLIHFDRDVLVESAAIVAGKGTCGGFYRMGQGAPLAIYCVDADIDSKDQQGILSDLGVLKAGEILRLDSSSHLGVETPGSWRLRELVVRVLD